MELMILFSLEINLGVCVGGLGINLLGGDTLSACWGNPNPNLSTLTVSSPLLLLLEKKMKVLLTKRGKIIAC
jgi:hypothetical protein